MKSTNTCIERWIEKAEPDYYTLFIKAWVPFNSWYEHNYSDEDATPPRVSDKDIINYIKNEDNLYLNHIKNLLMGNTDAALYFKECIANLHYQLENHFIPKDEEKISFSSICLGENSITSHSLKINRFTCKAEYKQHQPRKTPRFIIEVIENKSTRTVARIELFKASIKELHNNPVYLGLETKLQIGVEACLNEINPKKKENVIANAKLNSKRQISKPELYIVIDQTKNLCFIKDVEKVSKSIISIIYQLRCMLFHGELDPTEANSGIYEYAYKIQKILIKELQ